MPGFIPSGGTARPRLAAALAAGFLHLALILALIRAFGVTIAPHQGEALLSVFRAAPKPDPPSPLPPRRAHPEPPGGEPAPRPRTLPAAPAPSPLLALVAPSPIPAAPRPADGSAPSGQGGGGAGSGSGNGSGSGGGAGGSDAVQIAGEIAESDYPRDAVRRRLGGRVGIRFTVGVNGRVSDCAVTRPSGVASLDDATCRLILRRFRYEPARDAAGHPRPQVIEGVHTWRFAGTGPDYGEEAEEE